MPAGAHQLRLVIDTATAACSVALLRGDEVVASAHEVVGRGHAERLMPMIAALPGGGRADRILVDCGPGSFTGVRVGLAAARALGLGWGSEVYGFSSTALIAAMSETQGDVITVAMTGGHGELFLQRYQSAPLAPLTELASLTPQASAAMTTDHDIHGSGAEALVEARGTGHAWPTLPDAAQAWRLPADLTCLPPRPIYGRDADAKPAA